MASDCRKANGYSKGSLLMLELGVMECARGPNIKSTAVKKRLLPDHKSPHVERFCRAGSWLSAI